MINQVITHYEGLDEYLKVVDAYVDIFLQNHMVRFKFLIGFHNYERGKKF